MRQNSYEGLDTKEAMEKTSWGKMDINVQEQMEDLPGSTGLFLDEKLSNIDMSNMTEEEKRAVITEYKIGASKDLTSQIIDRVVTNSFQG